MWMLFLRLVVMPQCAKDGRHVFGCAITWSFTVICRVHYGQLSNSFTVDSHKSTFALREDDVAMAVAKPLRARLGIILVHRDPHE